MILTNNELTGDSDSIAIKKYILEMLSRTGNESTVFAIHLDVCMQLRIDRQSIDLALLGLIADDRIKTSGDLENSDTVVEVI